MKRKILTLSLVLMLVLSTFTCTYADSRNMENRSRIAVPYLQNIAYVDITLDCYNNIAECFVDAVGNTNATKIVVNMYLSKMDSEGLITNVASWTNNSSNSSSLRVLKTAGISSGYTYILNVSVTAYVGTKAETINKSVSYEY